LIFHFRSKPSKNVKNGFRYWGFCDKVWRKGNVAMVRVYLDFRGQFHQHFMSSFYSRRSESAKRQSSHQCLLPFWGLHTQKLHIRCCWNWHKVSLHNANKIKGTFELKIDSIGIQTTVMNCLGPFCLSSNSLKFNCQ